MAAIVTTNMRVYAANEFISGIENEYLYLFIGGTLPWPAPYSDNSPPTPTDDEVDLSAAYRNMMSAKLVSTSNVNLVVPRNNWTPNTVYTEYDNNIDLFNPTSGLPPFYVLSDSLNVYKCLSNNGGVASSIQPTSTSTTVSTLADGYQWKYMFTINSASVLSFVTNEWFPVQTLTSNDGSAQWQVQANAIPGTVDRIDIVTPGSQYISIPSVAIVGDGTLATASATVNGGNVVSIVVTNPGSNYTWANVVITGGGSGANGATANAVISPFLGHGADPVTELGGFYVLIDQKLTYDESGTFTVSNDYRQIGLLSNPLLNDGITPAVALDYSQMLSLAFGSTSGTIFNNDEVITGSVSGATGIVVDYDNVGLVLRLAQVIGSFVPGETAIGSEASGVLQTITGTAISGTSSTIVLPSTASAASGAYTGQTIKILSGTGAGQIRPITGYVGITRTATVSPNWATNPSSSSVFSIANIGAPALKFFSGRIIYLENRRPIQRASDQIEDCKIIVQF